MDSPKKKGGGKIQEAVPTMSQPSYPCASKTKRKSKADVQAFEREDGWGGRKRKGGEREREGRKENRPKREASRNST